MLDIDYIYSKISDNFKKQPGLKDILKSIQGELDWTTRDCEGVRYEVSVEKNEICIKHFYSYFGEKSKTLENNSRSAQICNISLNQEGGLNVLKSSAHYFDSKENRGYFTNKVKYEYEQLSYKKDSDEIISRKMVIPSQATNENYFSLTRIPFNNKEHGIYENCEDFDDIFLRLINYNSPDFQRNQLDEYLKDNYVLWSAVRDLGDPSKAHVSEIVQMGSEHYQLYTKDLLAPVNMSTPSVMRIDPPYGVKAYTEKELDALVEMKRNIHDNQEFYNAVIAQKYIEYINKNERSR